MATYDSKSSELLFYRHADVDGEVMHSDPIRVSLEGLTEEEKQMAIMMTKVAINFAKSHDPAKPSRKDGKGKSLVGKLLSAVERLKNSHAPAPKQGTEEASKEPTDKEG